MDQTLLEFKNTFFYWLGYLPNVINIALIIWILAVFFTWRLVSKRSLYGFFWGLFQSFLVFAVENGLISCSDVSFYLWIFTGVNLLALFSPVGLLIDNLNVIKDAFIFLFFSCVTFIILNRPIDSSEFALNEYFSKYALFKAVLPIYICY